MYKLRLGLLAILSVSALHGADDKSEDFIGDLFFEAGEECASVSDNDRLDQQKGFDFLKQALIQEYKFLFQGFSATVNENLQNALLKRNERINSLEQEFKSLNGAVGDHKDRLDRLDKAVEGHGEKINSLEKRLDDSLTISAVSITIRKPLLVNFVAKQAADFCPLVDQLPAGLKNNRVVNSIADISVVQQLAPYVHKQDVDRAIYAAAFECGSQLVAKQEVQYTSIVKHAAIAYALSAGTRGFHQLANRYGVESYVQTSNWFINNIAYGLVVKGGIGFAFGNESSK